MKRQPTEMEENFANDATDNGLISKIYKQLKQLNSKTQKTELKMGGRTKQRFLQRIHTDDQQAYEKEYI